MNVLREAASSIMEFLDFTSEVSCTPQSPLPVLDTQMWLEDNVEEGPWFNSNQAEEVVVPET